MTASPPAAPGMPSEEEIADLLQSLSPIGPRCRSVAARILSLIRPAFEAKDAEIAELKGKLAVRMDYLVGLATTADAHAIAAAEQRALSAESKLAQAVEAGKVVLSHRVGDLPTSGYLRDNGASRKALAELAAIIALAEGKEG